MLENSAITKDPMRNSLKIMTLPPLSHTPIFFGSRHAPDRTLGRAIQDLKQAGISPINQDDDYLYFEHRQTSNNKLITRLKLPRKNTGLLPQHFAKKVQKVLIKAKANLSSQNFKPSKEKPIKHHH